jgi:hypothetical protein
MFKQGCYVISKSGSWIEYNGTTNEFVTDYKHRIAVVMGSSTKEVTIEWVRPGSLPGRSYPIDAFDYLACGDSLLVKLVVCHSK